MGWFRRHYGAGPFHLLGLLACFAASAYVVVRIWDQGGLVRIALWFVLAIVAHDLILWPTYALADRYVLRAARRRRASRVPWINHVRAPVFVSGALLMISFPLVLGLNRAYYAGLTGRSETPYLWHWLLVTAGLFAASGLIYVIRLAARARGAVRAADGRAQGRR